MRNSVGTATNTIIYTRKRQKGNRRCKNCVHLKYSANPTKDCSYRCDVTGEPKEFTKKCYCKHYKSKD